MADRLTLPDWSSLAAQADESVPLLETALLIARDEYPDLDADLYDTLVEGHVGHLRPEINGIEAWPLKMAAINRHLFHWESQSTTPEDGPTGRRYRGLGPPTTQLFFARLHTTTRAFWFLGPAHYVEHAGERPMAITWRLEHPLPGDLFALFAAAVA